jgi:hypothetical protein
MLSVSVFICTFFLLYLSLPSLTSFSFSLHLSLPSLSTFSFSIHIFRIYLFIYSFSIFLFLLYLYLPSLSHFTFSDCCTSIPSMWCPWLLLPLCPKSSSLLSTVQLYVLYVPLSRLSIFSSILPPLLYFSLFPLNRPPSLSPSQWCDVFGLLDPDPLVRCIRIWIRILLSLNKNSKNNHVLWLLYGFFSLKRDENVWYFQKLINRKTWKK